MAWLLAMQGPPSKLARSLIYQVQESADRAKLAEEIASAATLDRVLPVPAVFGGQRQETQPARERSGTGGEAAGDGQRSNQRQGPGRVRLRWIFRSSGCGRPDSV